MSVDPTLLPTNPSDGEPLPPKRQPGDYPGFSTLSQSPFWDEATRDVVETRVSDPPQRRFFTELSGTSGPSSSRTAAWATMAKSGTVASRAASP